MDFNDTDQEAEFRREVRDWIARNAPTELWETLNSFSFGQAKMDSDALMRHSKAWQRKKHAGGWACLNWPKAYGGRDATPIERVIWQQEEGVYAMLSAVFTLGIGMCGPTLLENASEAQCRRHLPKIASGEEVWCQLFSEPSGGSDLAGLRTSAKREGDEWVVDGQKIWTTGAHYSDYGLLLARTDFTVPKHRGLTMFYVDMKTPGIEVRPIKQLNGQSEFNEVYFTGARIPDAQRIGDVGAGWHISLTTLMNERLAVGGVMPTGFPEMLAFCEALQTDAGPAIEDPDICAHLAGWAIRHLGLKHTSNRTLSALSNGKLPGPENSIAKLVISQTLQEIAHYAMSLQGDWGILVDEADAVDEGRFQAYLLRSPGMRIEGGTDEILRNIIGERVLGLPADIRVDKTMPFNQIPVSGTAPSHPAAARSDVVENRAV
ncbi:acyl-CoA dehydrogenase [Rhizorhabdus wittichii DC-6]|nr:acyl-CoA dehydrogenase [Rhizorhabdus wittichii DC-6]